MDVFILDEFFDHSSISNYKVGDILDENILQRVIERSNNVNSGGVSELMLLMIDYLKLSIGIDDDDKLKYLMIKIPKYNDNIDLVYKGFSLSKNNLNDILIHLNNTGTHWYFTEILGKIVKLKINKIELIYSYETEEVGLYSIQSVR